MKELKEIKKVEVVTYVAEDGTKFDTKDACKYYEDRMEIKDARKELENMKIAEITEVDLLDAGDDYYGYLIINPKDKEELDKLNALREILVDGTIHRKIPDTYIGKEIMIFSCLEEEYLSSDYFTTLDELIDGIKSRYEHNKEFYKEK